MSKINSILISIDFRADKGGISRVANLMSRSLTFDAIYSLHGDEAYGKAFFFNNKRIKFFLRVMYVLIIKRPDTVIFDHLNIARILAVVPKFLLKKVVLFVYDEEVWIKVTGLRKSALSKTTHILCISDHSMQKFLKENPEYKSKAKLCLLAGVPDAFVKLGNKNIISDHYSEWFRDPRPYGIFVSRLWRVHRYKGHFELLEAFKQHYLKSSTAKLRLAIIGNGDDAPEVKKFISDHKLEYHVKLFSGLNDIELVAFYKNSTALLFPSIREGFGFVFLEAMFFKKACIGIKNQPAEEIISIGESGVLLNDNKPETLRMTLEDIEKFPEKYQKYGESGNERYLAHFTNEHFKERFLNCIS